MEAKENSSLSVGNLVTNLDCAICLETVHLPRRLDCNHYFCKHCLDNLLKFTKRGGCTIKCPKQCSKITNIPRNKTTNDLGTDYMIKGILDMVAEDRKKHVQKHNCDKSGCTKDQVKYCGGCDSLYCHKCECACAGEKYNVMYDGNEDLKVLCKEHSAVAKWVCVHGNVTDFVCVYCVNRTHQSHKYQTIDQYACAWYSKLRDEENEGTDEKMLVELSKEMGLKASKARVKLIRILQYRKLLCLEQYVNHLENQDVKTLNTFEKYFKDHMEKLGMALKDKGNSLVYADIRDKNDVPLAMKLSGYPLPTQPCIPLSTVSLSAHNSVDSFLSISPLGQISFNDDENKSHCNFDGAALDSMTFDIPEVDDLSVRYDALRRCLRRVFPDIYQGYHSETIRRTFEFTKDGMMDLELSLKRHFKAKNEEEKKAQNLSREQLMKKLNDAQAGNSMLNVRRWEEFDDSQEKNSLIVQLTESLDTAKADINKMKCFLDEAWSDNAKLTHNIKLIQNDHEQENRKQKMSILELREAASNKEARLEQEVERLKGDKQLKEHLLEGEKNKSRCLVMTLTFVGIITMLVVALNYMGYGSYIFYIFSGILILSGTIELFL